MDKNAITSAVEALKPAIKSVAEELNAPLAARVADLETKGMNRPLIGADHEFSNDGHTFRPIVQNTTTRGFRGRISIPGMNTQKVSLGKIARAMWLKRMGESQDNCWKDAGYEHDVWKEVAKQRTAASLGNDSSAGFLIPNEIVNEIIENLRAESVMGQLGVQQMTGLTSSPVQIRRRTGSSAGYWVGESTSITKSQPTYDRIQLTPKKCAALIDVTGDLLRRDPAAVTSEIEKDGVLTLQLKKEVAFFEGTGAAGQPLGLDNVVGINTSSAISTHDSTEVAKLLTLIEEVAVDNVNLVGAKWVMHTRAWYQICSLLNSGVANTSTFGAPPVVTMGSGAPNGSITAALPSPSLFGFPVILCNSLTASTTTIIKFVVPSQIIWAEWGSPELVMSTEAGTAFQNDEVWFRLIHEVDVNVRHPEAICTSVYTY